MDKLKNRFLEMKGIDNYQRVDPEHPVPLFIGVDSISRYSLFCITESLPSKNVLPSRIITVFIGARQDGTYGITFSLSDSEFLDQFVCFCADMIESTRLIKDAGKVADYLCARYEKWQRVFSKGNNGLLTFAEIKGLIGEMCFLQGNLMPKIGETDALLSWCGPEMSDRDFEYHDTWFEVKTTVSGAADVTISSVEQLDCGRDGHLAVIYLDKTSPSDSSALTLNKMYHALRNSFSSELLKQKLDTLMLTFGYYENDYYENYCFHYNGFSVYRVGSDFPCIRKKNLPVAAQNIRYSLSLSAIQEFKEV